MAVRFVLPALALLLSACVPRVGDYSEFVLRGDPPALEQRQTTGFIHMAGGRYEGTLRGGYPHGSGTFAFSDGRRYTGEFDTGRLQGKGVMTYGDGRRVEGLYQGDRETDVVLHYPDGRQFEGVVAQGVPAGRGIMTHPQGDTLQGEFDSRGRLQGEGYHEAADGTPLYFGKFADGQRQGQGLCPDRFCQFERGKDVTEVTLQKAAAAEVTRAIDEAFNQEKAQAAARHESADKALREEREAQNVLKGPEGECYCILVRGWSSCPSIGITTYDEEAIRNSLTPEQRKARIEQQEQSRRLESERRGLECRTRFAAWLGQPPPSAARRAEIDQRIQAIDAQLAHGEAQARQQAAEIEARRRQAQADRVEKERLAQLERDRKMRQNEAERRAELEKQRARCDARPGAASCRCRAVYAALGLSAPARSEIQVRSSGRGSRVCEQ